MTIKQWIRFGWLQMKVVRAGYCPLHMQEFHPGYKKERECRECISIRVAEEDAKLTKASADRYAIASKAYEEMVRLANSDLPPAATECGVSSEPDAARKD